MQVQRAYSFLHVKSVDGEKRTITGTATTPTPDRMGDIIEPLGVSYKNPLPLLLYHNSQKPVGQVRFQKPTKNGIDFEATLPAIDEPGTVKDRIDEAWQSIKAGLLAGVSIGFRALEEAYMKDTGSYRYLQTEVLELSLVAIPANAEALISTVKSLDIGLAETGPVTDREFRQPSPGVSGITRVVKMRTERQMKKTYAEQIAGWEATLASKTARMDEIMDTANDKGVTLDAAEQEEHDTLTKDVSDINAHITRLKDSEERQKAVAKPVVGDTAVAAAASRAGQVITVKSHRPKGIGFARYAMCLASAQGNRSEAFEIAKARYPDDGDIHMVLKTAVSAGTTTDATWAGPLVQYQNLTSEFIEFLRPQTIIGKFGTNGIPSLRAVPFNVRIPRQTSEAAAAWVGQGAPKPLTKIDFDTITMLWAKLACISVITQELARFSTPSAEAYVRDALGAAISKKMDVDFIDPAKAAVANVSPASITNGITPITASGTNAAAVRVDIQALFAAFVTANLAPEDGVWIMSGTTALALSMMLTSLGQPEFPGLTMKGGTFLGLPVIVSNYLSPGSSPATSLLVLVNASDIYLADDGQVVIDVSREASLQMDDAPTNNSATPTATSVVSMFQTNSLAIRAERIINWQRRRDAAVGYISNVAYA